MSPVSFSDNPDTIASDQSLDSDKHIDEKENKIFDENINIFDENGNKSDFEVSSSRESTGQDELSEEDAWCGKKLYIDTSLYAGVSRPRSRTIFSERQLYLLETEYIKDGYLSRSRKAALAKAFQLPENTIKVWFQNRRSKHKRKKDMPALEPFMEKLKMRHIKAITDTYNPYPPPISEPITQPPVVFHPAAFPYPLYMPCQPNFGYNGNEQFYPVPSHPEHPFHESFLPPGVSRISHLEALQSHVLNCCTSCSHSFIDSNCRVHQQPPHEAPPGVMQMNDNMFQIVSSANEAVRTYSASASQSLPIMYESSAIPLSNASSAMPPMNVASAVANAFYAMSHTNAFYSLPPSHASYAVPPTHTSYAVPAGNSCSVTASSSSVNESSALPSGTVSSTVPTVHSAPSTPSRSESSEISSTSPDSPQNTTYVATSPSLASQNNADAEKAKI